MKSRILKQRITALLSVTILLSSMSSAFASNFSDIDEHWAEESIISVSKQGIFTGITDSMFSPDETLTRAMFVTILMRMDNGTLLPQSDVAAPFTDVVSGSYYEDAVLWAYRMGLVTGATDTLFAPDQPVKCEQMFAILYRYAEKCNYKITGDFDIMIYPDTGTISSYAMDATIWAMANDLFHRIYTGIIGAFTEATRGQAAYAISQFQANVSHAVLT